MVLSITTAAGTKVKVRGGQHGGRKGAGGKHEQDEG
jgi:hypothetical protein